MAWLSSDGRFIVAARAVRTFAYGYLSVLLGVYLEEVGLAPWQIGTVLTATLASSAGLTVVFSLLADRYGRRRMLALSALLMAVAGAVFATASRYPILLLADLTGTVGAIGALFAAAPTVLERWIGWEPITALRAMFGLYTGLALCVLFLFTRLSSRVELPVLDRTTRRPGLGASRGIVVRLAALFALDSLAGGFVVQSLIAYWLHLRWGAGPGLLGPVFFGIGLMQAGSFLVAGKLAGRIGLINTMVFTHLPSDVLLMFIPAAPSLPWAIVLLLARHALSQMDVPTRQSYTMAVVAPEERTATAATTNVVRNVAQAITPALSGAAMQTIALGLPFMLAGGLKIIYDLLLYFMFRRIHPPEEQT